MEERAAARTPDASEKHAPRTPGEDGARASPDRGAARFLREAAHHAPRTALWLVPADEAAQAGHAARWQNWLLAEKPDAPLFHAEAAALAWLNHP